MVSLACAMAPVAATAAMAKARSCFFIQISLWKLRKYESDAILGCPGRPGRDSHELAELRPGKDRCKQGLCPVAGQELPEGLRRALGCLAGGGFLAVGPHFHRDLQAWKFGRRGAHQAARAQLLLDRAMRQEGNAVALQRHHFQA